MQISILVILLALSLILVIIGYTISFSPVLSISGFTIIFLIGVVVSAGAVQYKSGEIIDKTNTSMEVVTYNYSDLTQEVVLGIINVNHIAGFLLSVIGMLGFVDVFINFRGLKSS